MDDDQNSTGVFKTPLPAIADTLPSRSRTNVGDSGSSPTKLDLSGQTNQTVKLDELGPMIVNSDGTLSRIANWNSMTKPEQERTLRVLSARNRLRLANEEEKQLERVQETGSAFTSEQPALSILGTTATLGSSKSATAATVHAQPPSIGQGNNQSERSN